jgi:beta-xylosidase
VVVATRKIDSSDNYKAIDLRAEVDQHSVSFSFSLDEGKTYQNLGEVQNADILTTNYAGGFTGSVVGLCAVK